MLSIDIAWCAIFYKNIWLVLNLLEFQTLYQTCYTEISVAQVSLKYNTDVIVMTNISYFFWTLLLIGPLVAEVYDKVAIKGRKGRQ